MATPSRLYHRFHSSPRLQTRLISPTNFTYRHLLAAIAPYLKPHSRILDIGCGVGTVDFYLASLGHHVTGLDISSTAIKTARENAALFHLSPRPKFLKANFPHTSIKQRFDLIIASEVLEHLPDDKLALKTIYPLLKKGGILILTTPSQNAPLHRLGLLRNFDRHVGHLRRYTPQNLSQLVKSSRFRIVSIQKTEGLLRNLLFTTPPLDQIVRVANRFPLFSHFLTFLDHVSLRLFGESNLYLTATKS